MAETLKVLGQGQLPNAEGSLYLVPGGTTAVAKKITIHNRKATTETVIIYIKKSGGTSRIIIYVALKTRYTIIDDDPHALGAGDDIRGQTTTAAEVDYTVDGIEFT